MGGEGWGNAGLHSQASRARGGEEDVKKRGRNATDCFSVGTGARDDIGGGGKRGFVIEVGGENGKAQKKKKENVTWVT